MNRTRSNYLQPLLEKTIGSKNVYFQPPKNVQMKYPAIVYSLSRADSDYANDNRYNTHKRYEINLIDKDPDTDKLDRMLELPMCSFDRTYKADGLYHYVFTLYFKEAK